MTAAVTPGSVAAELMQQAPPVAKARPRSNGNGSTARPFDAVNAIDTIAVLDALGIDHEKVGEKELATCPGCGESGALVCKDGGCKCLHNRCSDAGPTSAPGFRSNVDLVMVSRGLDRDAALEWLAAGWGIELPPRTEKQNVAPEDPGDPDPDYVPSESGEEIPPSEQRVRVETAGGVFKPVETAPRAPLRVLSAAEVFSVELTAPAWVVRGLQIGPGRPTLFAGYSYSLKSLLALVTALSTASGQPLWGRYHVRRVRVLVLDFEGGDTVLRLRRLAVSMGLDFDDLVSGDWINVAPAPDRFLDDADAVAWLTEACSGFGLVVADSLRQAAPNADENSSEIGVTLAVPTRVSMATGCSFVLVAHSGKTSKDQTKDTRQTATRGSSAIFSQAGNVLHVDRDETRPGVHRVKQRKRPTGAWGPGVEPVTVRVHDDDENSVTLLEHDQDDDGTDRLVPAKVPGLVIELLEEAEPVSVGVIADTLEDLILAELKRRSPQSRGGLARALSKRKTDVLDAVTKLLGAGRLSDGERGLTLTTSPDSDLWEGIDDEL